MYEPKSNILLSERYEYMITGIIDKILTQKENNWGRYKLSYAGKDILVVGVIPDVSIGMLVTLEGTEEDNKYGHQFKIKSVVSQEADKNAGVRRFLTDGYLKGIGKTKAEAIIEAYGKDALSMFDTEEGRKLLCTVKGITKNVLDKVMPSYEENKKYKDIIEFLNGAGTKAQVEHIYELYGDQALTVLKKNPYRLQLDLDGFGFLRADKLALASGIKSNSKYRIMAAIKYELEEAEMAGGHCYLTMDEIKSLVIPLLSPMPKFEDITERVAENAARNWPASREKLIKAHNPSMETLDKIAETMESREYISGNISEALSEAVNDGSLVAEDGKIYTKKMYSIECDVAKMLAKMISQNPVRYASKENIEAAIEDVEKRKTGEFINKGIAGEFKITKEQRDAVFLALMHRVSIISGGPGRGKTAISEIVAHGFLKCGKSHSPKDVIMLAPTGRAAQRITESTGYDSMTIHRAIIESKRDGEPHDKLILVDESSMVDIYLAKSLLSFAKYSNLVFVGDVDQIASVGPGKVLKDLIASGDVPCILLTQGHRNSGTIAHNSQLINSGLKLDAYAYDEHFIYTPCTIDNIKSTIIKDYILKIKEYGIENVMLCTAMKERGAVAVNGLNTSLQEIITKGQPEARIGAKLFRRGDRVMQTKNDYSFIKLSKDKLPIEGVFNGEKGSIVSIKGEGEEVKIIVRFDDGSLGGYTYQTAQNLTLAYATTLHKCQGSEAPCMMMAYTHGDYILLNRSLFYTGETRAKKEFRFYGEEKIKYGKILSAFDIAVSKLDDKERNTTLAERLHAELENI